MNDMYCAEPATMHIQIRPITSSTYNFVLLLFVFIKMARRDRRARAGRVACTPSRFACSSRHGLAHKSLVLWSSSVGYDKEGAGKSKAGEKRETHVSTREQRF